MNCTRNRDGILDLARHLGEPDDPASAEGERLRAHLSQCDWCRRRFEEQQTLTGALRALARDAEKTSGQVDFEAMERRLLERFEQKQGRDGVVVPGPGAIAGGRDEAETGRGTLGAAREATAAARGTQEPARTAGPVDGRIPGCGHARWRISNATGIPWLRLAALLVLAVGAAVMWRTYGPGARGGSPATEEVSAQADRGLEPDRAAAPDGANPADVARMADQAGAPDVRGAAEVPVVRDVPGVRGVPAGPPSNAPSRGDVTLPMDAAGPAASAARADGGARAAGPTRDAGDAPRTPAPRLVEAAGFVPLPIAASLPPFERGEIVRVEMTMALLPSYGVEIPPDAGDEPIEVDLLVAQDGLARAIRLVTAAVQDSRSRQ